MLVLATVKMLQRKLFLGADLNEGKQGENRIDYRISVCQAGNRQGFSPFCGPSASLVMEIDMAHEDRALFSWLQLLGSTFVAHEARTRLLSSMPSLQFPNHAIRP